MVVALVVRDGSDADALPLLLARLCRPTVVASTSAMRFFLRGIFCGGASKIFVTCLLWLWLVMILKVMKVEVSSSFACCLAEGDGGDGDDDVIRIIFTLSR